MGIITSLYEPSPVARAAGSAFAVRQKAWRRRDQKFYARHAGLEPYAPQLLAAMFSQAVRYASPGREYVYYVPEAGIGVRLNVENWFWYVLDGSAQGRGLYEMWAWRWGVPVTDAASMLWHAINADTADEAPK